jgi:hypothetical protein
MKTHVLLNYPQLIGIVLAVATLLAGVIALLSADFGMSGWGFVPLFLWLATVGLPAMVAVLLLAAVWGAAGPLYGFGPFCILAILLAVGSEVLFVRGILHFVRGRHEN